jgi:hypothetical protein
MLKIDIIIVKDDKLKMMLHNVNISYMKLNYLLNCVSIIKNLKN